MNNSFQAILGKSDLIVSMGAGGVGKTTMSVVMGFAAALQGKKVAILSIDPAKRLAAALGLELDGAMSQVVCEQINKAGGAVDAAMLDHQTVFDDLVEKYSPNAKVAAKLGKGFAAAHFHSTTFNINAAKSPRTT